MLLVYIGLRLMGVYMTDLIINFLPLRIYELIINRDIRVGILWVASIAINERFGPCFY